MVHIALRWRRALLGSLLAALTLVAALAGVAHATLNLETRTSLSIDSDVHWWNGLEPVTNGANQYVAYWDAANEAGVVYPKLTRRTLATNRLQSITFNGREGTSDQHLINVNDAHNVIAIGLSPNDGRIHLSWSPHHDVHHYGISEERCLSKTNLTECTFTWGGFMTSARDIEEGGTSVLTEEVFTYPYFFNDSRGRLYFSYRFGVSQRGDQFLNVYNDNGTWTSLGMIMLGRIRSGAESYEFTEGGGATVTSRERGIYPQEFRFDKRDRLHAMWVWREITGPWDHGYYYAYSDDFGRTWNTNSGTRFATATTDPIVVNDSSALVYNAPAGSYPGYSYFRVDSNNQPHLIVSRAETIELTSLTSRARILHLWRTTDGTWYSRYVEPTSTGNHDSFGAPILDAGDNLNFLYNHDGLDWVPYNADAFRQAELITDHVTWQERDFLNVVPTSAVTALDTTQYVNTPIETSRGSNDKISIRLKNNTVGTLMDFYWTTDASQVFSVARHESIAITANDREYKTYTMTVANRQWTGNLRQLEIYPAGLGDVHGAGKDISIDYIRITDDRERPVTAKAWEFQDGVSVRYASASSATNWETWSIQELLPGVSDTRADSIVEVDQQRYLDSGLISFANETQGAPGTEGLNLTELKATNDTVAKDWNFPVDAEEWFVESGIERFGWINDGGTLAIGGTLNEARSSIGSAPSLGIPLGNNTLQVVLKNNTTETQARFWYITTADRRWSSTRGALFTIRARSGYSTYEIDMREAPGWSGSTLYQVALEPTVVASSGTFALDSMTIRRPAP